MALFSLWFCFKHFLYSFSYSFMFKNDIISSMNWVVDDVLRDFSWLVEDCVWAQKKGCWNRLFNNYYCESKLRNKFMRKPAKCEIWWRLLDFACLLVCSRTTQNKSSCAFLSMCKNLMNINENYVSLNLLLSTVMMWSFCWFLINGRSFISKIMASCYVHQASFN
jgi:hypothetical protein